MNVELRGGKTAPRLLQDLVHYNPHQLPATGYNILTDLSYQFEENKEPPPNVAPGSCRHEWALKEDQSTFPERGRKQESQSRSVVAAYCIKCRSHLELSLSPGGSSHQPSFCPTPTSPLHHFLHKPNNSPSQRRSPEGDLESKGTEEWFATEHFQCSFPACSAVLVIRFRSSRLRTEWIDLLTDPNLVNARAVEVMKDDPERFEGHPIPKPVDVLVTLRQYLVNAMSKERRRIITGNNKKWLLCLGEPCVDLLLYLGFIRQEQDWIPPSPQSPANIPFQEPLNILLDDVEKELLVLISERPNQELRPGSIPPHSTPISAMNAFARVSGCMDYLRSPHSRTTDLTLNEHPFYAGLGAVWDFHDDLIVFAYDRQVACDARSLPYYLECLQGIAEGRTSESLQTQAAVEASKENISLRDIRGAYKDFGFEFRSPFLDDDVIIGAFQSRVSDAPKQETQLRRALRIIGQDRSSNKIQQVASNVVSNYEQALSWLAATEDMSDDFLVSMYSIKVDESPLDEKTARHAVSLIADHRKSDALRSWLETGVLGEIEMDVGQAYNRFGISDRTIDDDTILTAYNYHVSEAPSQTSDLRSALTAIAKAKNSKHLQNFLHSGMVSSEHPPSEWPVGLENIGNTCYLNSLLQFFFTVKPLRDLVLKFDDYKMPINEESLLNKQVGSRKVSRKEVERAQRFVYELQKLFRDMITSPNAQVTPEAELARLTLISSNAEERIRRQSMLSGHRPSVGEIGGRPIFGPFLPSSPSASEKLESPLAIHTDGEVNDSPQKIRRNEDADNLSDVTLVEPPLTEESDVIMLDPNEKAHQDQTTEDKENLPPDNATTGRSPTPEGPLHPLEESAPSRTNQQQKPLDPTNDRSQVEDNINSAENVPPPKRPPPCPPRPKPQDTRSTTLEEVEIGAQQDVTEVIANVLFQLQCAIRAESFDVTGEQLDQIKRLFFGKHKSYTTDSEGLIRTKEEFISDIKVDVASGPRDIYAALDGAYDVQQVEVGGALEPQFTSISQIPPVLQVHVQRAQFDLEKKTSFKSNHHLELKDTVYMDRYMDLGDQDLMQRRKECWAWKEEIKVLEERKLRLSRNDLDLNISEVLAMTQAYLTEIDKAISHDNESMDIPTRLLESIAAASEETANEISIIDAQIKTLSTNVQSQFSDLRTLPYRLHSVFIHRGYVNSGHYWIYIHDFVKKVWRKYNDGYVTEVKDVKEIFEREAETRPATPYFLVYIHDSLKTELVEPVCRAIVQPSQDLQDAAMHDADDGHPELLDLIDLEPRLPQPTIDQNSIGATPDWDSGGFSKYSADW